MRIIDATDFLRKMRGRSQAHLLRANDGLFYVTKFLENPQGARALVNEILCSAILKNFGISTPKTALVRVTPEFLASFSDVYISVGDKRIVPKPGLHFGSAYPCDPHTTPVCDFLPDPLLAKVINSGDFLGVLVCDQWTGKADARQAIFVPEDPSCSGIRGRWIAHMIGNSGAFGGNSWTMCRMKSGGLYHSHAVYRHISLAALDRWFDMVTRIGEASLRGMANEIPCEWLSKQETAKLEQLLDDLYASRSAVPDQFLQLCSSKPDLFPDGKRHK